MIPAATEGDVRRSAAWPAWRRLARLGVVGRIALSLALLVVGLALADRALVALNDAGLVLPSHDVRLLPYHDPRFTRRDHALRQRRGAPPTVVFTGDSRVMNGIDPEAVAKELGRSPDEFFNFATGLQSVPFTREVLVPHLVEIGVKPRYLVIGVTPDWYGQKEPRQLIDLYRASAAYQLGHDAGDPWDRRLTNRVYAALARSLAVVRYSRELVEFELMPSLRGLFEGGYYVEKRYLGERGMTFRELARAERRETPYGWTPSPLSGRTRGVYLYGPRFGPDVEVDTKALQALVREARQAGIEPILLWMPAHSSFWSVHDGAARARAEASIRSVAAAERVTTLQPRGDYESGHWFVDGHHFSVRGASAFSRDVAHLLGPRLTRASAGEVPIVGAVLPVAPPSRTSTWLPISFTRSSYWLLLPVAWLLVVAAGSAQRRLVILLLLSYGFYASWSLGLAALLLVSSVANHLFGLALLRRRAPALLWAGIGFNVALIVLFRETWLFGGWGTGGTTTDGMLVQGGLAVGLSFYTFQAIGHLCDVSRGEDERPSLLEFMTFMAFWPTVLAGPICRVHEMLPQLRQDTRPAPADVAEGARRIVLGLFLKLVVADTLANGLRPGEGVSSGFDRVGQAWGGADVIVLALGFGLQLYFDFAGYSHVAIGSARLLGFRVRENFADPYLSRTPPAMWSRWHMSLSSWIRDYLFFPLALLRRGAAWRMVVVVLSMAVFGIWHGFRLTFLLWGVYHGLVQVGHRLGQQLGARWGIARRVPRLLGVPLSWGLTFGFVTLGWIFFRASSLGQAAGMLGAVLDPRSYLSLTLKPNAYLMIVAVLVGYLLVAALRSLAARWEDGRVASPLIDIALPAAYAALALLVLGWSRPVATFLYFQF